MKQKINKRDLALIWILGLVGQLCWNVENQWFNTFIYAKIGPHPWIISWMTAISATATTFSTFFFGTHSDRAGKRRPYLFFGYLFWGVFTILFGAMEFLPANRLMAAAVMVIAMDALMSFFGSMGNDCAFNSWTTDITGEHNRGQRPADRPAGLFRVLHCHGRHCHGGWHRGCCVHAGESRSETPSGGQLPAAVFLCV